MDSSIALNRMQAQRQQHTSNSVQVVYDAIVQASPSPPITLDELRSMLMLTLEIPPETCATPLPEQAEQAEQVVFRTIYDFVEWYDKNRQCFSEQQQVALNTLYDTRMGIEQGCACRRPSREAMAFEYFGRFWTNNQNNDLLPSVARAANAKKVVIMSLCEWPTVS